MELGSYFLFLQEQIKDIIIIGPGVKTRNPLPYVCVYYCSTYKSYYEAVRVGGGG